MKRTIITTWLCLHIVMISAAQITRTKFVAVCDIPFKIVTEAGADSVRKISIYRSDQPDSAPKVVETNWDNKDVVSKMVGDAIRSMLSAEEKKDSNSCNKNGAITSATIDYFFDDYIESNVENSQPQAGRFKVYAEPNYYLNYLVRDLKTKTIKGIYMTDYKKVIENQIKQNIAIRITYKLEEVKCEIVDGFIQNLVALVTQKDTRNNTETHLQFALPYPAGMTSFRNLSRMKDIELVDLRYFRLNPKGRSKKTPLKEEDLINTEFEDPIITLKVGDLIYYNNDLGVERRDFSPMDTTFTLAAGASVQLRKQETKKLFEAKVFSDFIGIDADKPNGLIQVEVQKRINLNTVQHLNKCHKLKSLWNSYGFFNHITPVVSINKIEENNRRLFTRSIDNLSTEQYDTAAFDRKYKTYVSFMDLYRYQSFSGGFDLNLFYVYNHYSKFDLSFNSGVRLGLTPIADSFNAAMPVDSGSLVEFDKFSIPTFQFIPEVKIRFLPEERFNFAITNRFIYGTAFYNRLYTVGEQESDYEKIELRNGSWIYSPELMMSVFLNGRSGNKVYARLKYNVSFNNKYENFTQIQVGYSTFILGR